MAEPKQPNCNICGRFARKVVDDDGTFIRWTFTCVSWDDYMGAWEHE